MGWVRRLRLEAAPDLWSAIEPLIDDAREEARFIVGSVEPLLCEIEEKYRRGEAEHGRSWTRYTAEDFDRAIAEELIDLIAYCAMREALYPRVPTFFTNADPGDEQPD